VSLLSADSLLNTVPRPSSCSLLLPAELPPWLPAAWDTAAHCRLVSQCIRRTLLRCPRVTGPQSAHCRLDGRILCAPARRPAGHSLRRRCVYLPAKGAVQEVWEPTGPESAARLADKDVLRFGCLRGFKYFQLCAALEAGLACAGFAPSKRTLSARYLRGREELLVTVRCSGEHAIRAPAVRHDPRPQTRLRVLPG